MNLLHAKYATFIAVIVAFISTFTIYEDINLEGLLIFNFVFLLGWLTAMMPNIVNFLFAGLNNND